MNKITTWLAAGVATLPSLVRAEGTTPTVDLTAAEGAADAIGTAVSGLITGKIMTNVLLVVGAALGLWALFFVVRYIKRGGKA